MKSAVECAAKSLVKPVVESAAAFAVAPCVILVTSPFTGSGAVSAASACASGELCCGAASGTVCASAAFACLPATVSCGADCAEQIVLAAGAISKKELNTYLHHPRVIPGSLELIVRSDERRAGDGRRHLRRQEHRLPLHAAADSLLRDDYRVTRSQLRAQRISAPKSLTRTQDRAIRANHKNRFL